MDSYDKAVETLISNSQWAQDISQRCDKEVSYTLISRLMKAMQDYEDIRDICYGRGVPGELPFRTSGGHEYLDYVRVGGQDYWVGFRYAWISY